MKDVILIPNKKDYINVAEITFSYKGLVIGYKDSKPVGYVQFSDGKWIFPISTYWKICEPFRGETLNDLLNKLIDNSVCTNFKVIEFE